MSKYYVEPAQYGSSDFVWCVFEKSTSQIIKSFSFSDDAEDYCDFLNHGGAFDGNTPSFVLRSVAMKVINESFQEVFS